MGKEMKEETSEVKLKNYYKLSFFQKISYGVGDLGCNLIFQSISIFLLFFYTDIFGLKPIAVGTLFFAARIWDAVFDILIGLVVDRTSTKWGKFRPYILFGAFPLAIFAVLCFTSPNISYNSKLIYAYITYIGLGTCYTIVNVPYGAMTASITQDPVERTSLSSVRMFFAVIGGVVVSVLTPNMVKVIGGGNAAKGYQGTMIVIAVAALLLILWCFAGTEERLKQESKEKINFSQIISQLKLNGPLRVLLFIFVSTFTMMALTGSSALYYFTYNVKRPDIVGAFLGITMLPTIIGIMFVPMIVKKIGKKKAFILGNIIYAICKSLIFFVPYNNITLVFVLSIFAHFAFALPIALLWALVPDTVEYGELKTGNRSEGIVYALAGFGQKLGMAVGGALSGIYLGVIGYVANAQQSNSALMGLNALISIIPALFSIISIVLILLYKLDEKIFNDIVLKLQNQKETNY